jgi:hypothetical protein
MKKNMTSWEFYANESLSNGDKTYTYGLFGLDGGTTFSLLRSIIKYTISPGSSSSDSPSRIIPVITTFVSTEELSEGYSRSFKVNNQIKFEFNNESVIARVSSINSDSVVVNVSGRDYSINNNSLEKIDFNKDGYYDLQINVNSINYASGKSNIEFKLISEPVESEEQEEVIEEVEEEINNYVPEDDKNDKCLKITLIIIGIVILGLIIFFPHKKVKKEKRYQKFGY